MEAKLRTERKILRNFITKTYNSISEESKDNIKVKALTEDKFHRLRIVDNELVKLVDETDLEDELLTMEEYYDKCIEIIATFSPPNGHVQQRDSNQRKFKLPEIKIAHFDGQAKHWISYWAQFKKIADDDSILDEDKLQYLQQTTTDKAHEVVRSFPPTGANFKKALDALKTRFARDEVIVEYYVRQLLRLAQENKISIISLYDQLSSYIHALDSLGMTSDSYAAMLQPIVESSLPSEILLHWERHKTRKDCDASSVDVGNLNDLMSFLQSEVESEERVKAAKYSDFKIPTSAALVSKEVKPICIFCSKVHMSHECKQGAHMSLDEKQKLMIKHNVCFRCIKRGHSARECKTQPKCYVCRRTHHVIICPELPHHKEKAENVKPTETKTKNNSVVSNNCTNADGGAYMQTIVVYLINPNVPREEVKVRVLLDTGSQRSYILKDIAKRLKLEPVKQTKVNHSLFGGTMQKLKHDVFNVILKNIQNNFEVNLTVLDQDQICSYVEPLSDSQLLNQLISKEILLTDATLECEDDRIGVLLGADIIGTILTGKIVKHGKISCIETELGWTLIGSNTDYSLTCLSLNNTDVPKIWELETIGIEDPIRVKSLKDHEKQILIDFKFNIRKEGNRFLVKLPWAIEPLDLESNRITAEKRLYSVTNRLVKMKKINDYDLEIKSWLKEGIIEQVAPSKNNNVHFLPHRPVLKANSHSFKLRPVFDASCRTSSGRCLNDFLEKGPNLLRLLPQLLLKFRFGLIGATSDIKRAFLQVGLVSEEDRDKLRFLWYKDTKLNIIQEYRHARLVFGVNSSPFLLMATIEHHLSLLHNTPFAHTVSILQKSFYVDNSLSSFNSTGAFEKFMSESTHVMSLAGFELRGWLHTYLKDMSCCLNNSCMTPVNVGHPVSILGVLWDPVSDKLFCDLKFLQNFSYKSVTKRLILSILQQFFDPLGILNPLLLTPKCVLQETWKLKLPWDEPIPPDLERKFTSWLNEFKSLPVIEIPRCVIFNNLDCLFELHTFCDSSAEAYGAVSFLRVKLNECILVSFLQSKARIKPIKEQATIPRLELLGCLLGARLANTIQESFDHIKFFKRYFWSDSSVSISWIQVEKVRPVFISNRVSEILKLTNRDEWYHLRGNLNVADVLTRETKLINVLNSRWWLGPKFLKEDISKWPVSSINNNHILINDTHKVENKLKLFDKFSSFYKTVRVLSYAFMFINILKSKCFRFKLASSSFQCSFANENYSQAETFVLFHIQSSFDATKLTNLLTFRDTDNLLKVKTKLTLSSFEAEFKTPIILDGNHRLVQCLLMETHKNNSHAGVATLMTILRERFWIINCRKYSKQIIRKCVICRRFSAKCVERPEAPLPTQRLEQLYAFETSGVDLSGPCYLIDNSKVWIVLFTCSVYRAVHLELCSSLSTDSFLMVLRRFIARRGRMTFCYCDNATNFRGTYNALRDLDWARITAFSSVQNIKFHFNPPASPWWGGHYERLIGMMKQLLKRILGNSRLNFEELNTVLCDVEATLNARPLTYISNSTADLQPLTPSNFLHSLPLTETTDLDILEGNKFRIRLSHLQDIRDQLRSRFKKEYLAWLVQKAKNFRHDLSVGDVVLVMSDNIKRQNWPLAKVLELLEGADGEKRVAKLKTSIGILLRPVQRLVPLEVSSSEVLGGKLDNPVSIPSVSRRGREIKTPVRFLDYVE